MKKHEIHVGGRYLARFSGNLVIVRVDTIREVDPPGPITNKHGRVKPPLTVFDVTNLTTGRTTTFRSAMRFRAEQK